MWNNTIKFYTAISELKDSAEFSFSGSIQLMQKNIKKLNGKLV